MVGISSFTSKVFGASDIPISPDHDRCIAPGETLARLRPHFSRLGITRLGDLTGLDKLGIPVAFAARPNSFSLSVSLGKGPDRDSAFASAAMEAAEMAIAERLPIDPLEASVGELKALGRPTIDIGLVTRCQPGRMKADEPIIWVTGQNLLDGRPVLVPWALVGLDHRLAPIGYHDAFEVSSDGLASGNTPAEAVLHGICELIERDAYSSLQFLSGERLRDRYRSVCTTGDMQLDMLMAAVERFGLRVQLLDMTTDIGVPAYMAILLPVAGGEPGREGMALCGGCGCHPTRRRAIMRAITEAAQSRLALIAGARDDLSQSNYGFGGEPRQRQLSTTLCPLDTPTELIAPDDSPPETIGTQISLLLNRLSAAGISQVVVVQLDAEPFGVSVVRVIIPDLQIPLPGHRTQVSRRGLRSLVAAA
ncbi:YcaO-like family protein [soil metagenome]